VVAWAPILAYLGTEDVAGRNKPGDDAPDLLKLCRSISFNTAFSTLAFDPG
jgi:hypothetical protein